MLIRHWRPLLLVGLLVGVVVTCFGLEEMRRDAAGDKAMPTYPQVDYGQGADADLVKRGEYLVKAGDCISCHTAPGGKPFAGGLGIKTKFGTFYTPNITSDLETGIGTWSDEDFERALRQGVSPDGHNYYPVFPYTYFNKVTDDDVKAIHAYLSKVPAVWQKNKPHEVGAPYSWRWTISVWKLLFFHPRGEFKAEAGQTEQWNRGAYLVNGLGHCGECHTPHNMFGAPKKKYFLAGANVDGYFAPNITSSDLGSDSEGQVAGDLQGQLPGGAPIEGPMLEVSHESLKALTSEDRDAIAFYLQHVKSKASPAAKAAEKKEVKPSPEVAKIFNQYCSVCHNTGAAGAPKLGDAAAWAPRVSQGEDTLVNAAIHGLNAMPPRGTCNSCTDDEIRHVVEYMIASAQAAGGDTDEAAAPKAVTVADGESIYKSSCAVCHDDGNLGAPKLGDTAAWQPILEGSLETVIQKTLATHSQAPGLADKNNREIIAALIYMAEQGKPGSNYSLWLQDQK